MVNNNKVICTFVVLPPQTSFPNRDLNKGYLVNMKLIRFRLREVLFLVRKGSDIIRPDIAQNKPTTSSPLALPDFHRLKTHTCSERRAGPLYFMLKVNR